MSLHEAFERSSLPLLRALGFESAKAKKVKPGNTVALARRVIDPERRLEVTVAPDDLLRPLGHRA